MTTRIIDSRIHLVVAVEDDCPAGVFKQRRIGRYGFDYRSVGSKIASQNRQAPGRKSWVVQATNHVRVVDLGRADIFAQGLPGYGQTAQL